MIDAPKTKEQAMAHRYHQWSGNPTGVPYDESRCAYEIFSAMLPYQCSRKNGKGPEGLYCGTHAKKV